MYNGRRSADPLVTSVAAFIPFEHHYYLTRSLHFSGTLFHPWTITHPSCQPLIDATARQRLSQVDRRRRKIVKDFFFQWAHCNFNCVVILK